MLRKIIPVVTAAAAAAVSSVGLFKYESSKRTPAQREQDKQDGVFKFGKRALAGATEESSTTPRKS